MTRTIFTVAAAVLLSAGPVFSGGWAVELPNLTFPPQGTEAPQTGTDTVVSTRRTGD